jgi:nucleotide-binding universal stress UspA family protein
MSTTLSRADAPAVGLRALKAAPVIIATDGRAQSDSAVALGRLLAGDEESAVRVVSVVDMLPMATPEAGIPYSADIEASRRADRKRGVSAQVARMWGDSGGVDAEIYDGDASSRILDIAHESNASLIVAGIGRHRVVDRVFGDETALRLARGADVPVLAVAEGCDVVPRRIVVAVDFSETSFRAARMALDLAAPEATIYLVHVEPRNAVSYEWPGSGGEYRDDAGFALARLRDQLLVPSGMSAQRVLLYGDPSTELLAFASSVRADLIATGSHGYGMVTRLLIGSVATRIVRGATCNVLTVPYSAVMTHDNPVDVPIVKSPTRADWTSELDAFTKRNIGRRGVLEVDDPEIGAQAQEHDYPLLGATYDPHDDRVELMLGELGDVARHLSRSIGGVTRVDVLKNDRGRDIALRIAHGAGQTLLTFAG